VRWRGRQRSQNVEDRRGRRAPRGGLGGGPRRGRPMALSGGGLLLVLVVGYMLGADPADLLRIVGGEGPVAVDSGNRQPGRPAGRAGGLDDEAAEFVSVVLADTEQTWERLFREDGRRYQPPQLVLFTDAVQSACGRNSAAVGPFYCPADRKVYIDLAFYRDLRDRFGAPGDFAQAYVIAHEVGHHVQGLLGVSGRVQQLRQRASRAEGNALSVRLELQADCLAGVWGYHADAERQLLEQGDVEEGLNAAAAIGDDRIQRRTTGQVNPESWTHGSSEDRVRWFRKGLTTGDVEACDTFSAS